jgi:hypothetical protein
MKTIIEKDSPVPALLLLGGLILIFVVGGSMRLAYLGGVFTGKDAVAANDKRIAEQAAHTSSPTTDPAAAKP